MLTTVTNEAYKQQCLIERYVCPHHGLLVRSNMYLFLRLKYPKHLINSTNNTYVNSRVADLQLWQISEEMAGNDVTWVVMPFKDQNSAHFVKNLSLKLQSTVTRIC